MRLRWVLRASCEAERKGTRLELLAFLELREPLEPLAIPLIATVTLTQTIRIIAIQLRRLNTPTSGVWYAQSRFSFFVFGWVFARLIFKAR